MNELPVSSTVPAIAWTSNTRASSNATNRTFWSLVREIPYKLMVGAAFVLGCALLHQYLVSIDYVPTDLLPLLGLATLVSAWLALLWLSATVFMFAPVFTVMLYEVNPPRFWVMLVGLTSGTTLLLS